LTTQLSGKRVCVTGGAGFLGHALCPKLREAGVSDLFVPRSKEFDLTHAENVARMYDHARPDIVIHLAAEVGGIGLNQKHPGRFFYANMIMGLHLIEEARSRGLEKFVQVGSVCAYPKFCDVPFSENALWSGYPEETNAPYGIAKRALSVMLDAYRAEYGFNGVYLIPVNLYGPYDNFDAATSHVIPGLIRQFCGAADAGRTEVKCWGSGRASREFLYVDDAAAAIVRAASVLNDAEPINLGTGKEITIARLAETVARLCGFSGKIVWDTTKPDGQPRRCLDASRAVSRLQWQPTIGLEEGLRRTIDWWRNSRPAVRGSQCVSV